MSCVNKYISNIKIIMPLLKKRERAYLKDFKKQVLKYQQDSETEITYDDLVERFGTPKDIVNCYLEMQSNDYILKNIKFKKIITLTCLILALIAILIGLWKGILIYDAYKVSISQTPTHVEHSDPEVIK